VVFYLISGRCGGHGLRDRCKKQKLGKQKALRDNETTGLRGKSRNAESRKQKWEEETTELRAHGLRDYGQQGEKQKR
jgi:hypothetical protein